MIIIFYLDLQTVVIILDQFEGLHNIWKSVEEYKYCVEPEDRKIIENLSSLKIINTSLTEKIKNDQNVDVSTRESLVRKLDTLYECCIENNADFELVMIQAEDKLSTAIKGTEVFIRFDEEGNYKTYSDGLSTVF